jgi:hypothetical protein
MFTRKQICAAGLFISFFLGYLEWGKDSAAFVYEGFIEVISNAKGLKSNFTHPLIILPLIGEIIFILGTFNSRMQNKWLIAALVLTGLLYIMILLAGVLSKNPKMILSAAPYILFAIGLVIAIRKENRLKKKYIHNHD